MQDEFPIRKRLVAPSLLAANLACLGDAVERVEAGGADLVHFDVMDGRFVPNLSFGPPVLSAIRSYTDLPFDAHLMVEGAADLIAPMAAAGCDILTVHYEGDPHLHRTLGKIREASMRAGVAINPSTPVSLLEPVLDCLDVILIMSVNPGFGGQRFITGAFEKVRQARIMVDHSGLPIRVSVDGGVDQRNAGKLFALGADIVVAGTAVFGRDEDDDGDLSERIEALRGGDAGTEGPDEQTAVVGVPTQP